MNGVRWAAIIWSIVLAFTWFRERHRPADQRTVTRETVAMVIALLGTHSIVFGSDVEEILQDPVAGERVLRGVLAGVAMLLAGPPLLRRLTANQNHGHRGLFALTVYVGVAGISSLYSAAPLVSAAKSVELASGLAAIGAIALREDGYQHLKRTVNLVIALEVALLTVAVAGFFLLPLDFAQLQPRPGFISDFTMGSPYAHPNALSSMGALTGAYALSKVLHQGAKRQRVVWSGVVVVGLVGTLLASGRQGVAIWLISILVLLILHRPRMFLFAIVPATIWIIASFGDTIWQSLLRNRPTTFGSLNGRTVWWGAAIEAWRDHPWTGWGYGVGGRFVALESIGRGGTSNIHSGYFEALVGVGILGMIPLLYAVLRTLSWSVRTLLRRTETDVAILMLPLALRTGVAQGFGGWLNFELILFACLVALADKSWIGTREDLPDLVPVGVD
jgi:O-antigen ligase